MENNSDIIITGNTATWRMNKMEGSVGGSYTGTFVFRTALDPLRQLQAGKEYRALLGDLASQCSETDSNICFCLTQLKQRVVSAPAFWTSTLQDSGYAGNLLDLNILAAVLDAAIRAENEYKAHIEKERNSLLERSIAKAEAILNTETQE